MEDARRAEEGSVRWKRNQAWRVAPNGRTRYFLVQPSLPLIQATLVRGAFGASNTSASRYGEVAAIGTGALRCETLRHRRKPLDYIPMLNATIV